MVEFLRMGKNLLGIGLLIEVCELVRWVAGVSGSGEIGRFGGSEFADFDIGL